MVVGFLSDTDSRFFGVEFYCKQGNKLLSVGYIRNYIETMLDDDERIVGIASRNEEYATHYDFKWIIAKKP